MGRIVFPKVFSAGDHLKGSDLNAVLDAIGQVVNGGLSNENFSDDPLDKLLESLIQFNANTGHNHNGLNSKRIPLPPIVMALAGYVYNGLRTPPMELNEKRIAQNARILTNTSSSGETEILLEIYSLGDENPEWKTLKTFTLPANSTRLAVTYTGADIITLNNGDLIRLKINTTNSTPPEGLTLQIWENLI